MATIQQLEAEYRSLLAQRDELAQRYQAGDTSVLPAIQDINADIRRVLFEIDELGNTVLAPSSGTIVGLDQDAHDDGANTQFPEPETEFDIFGFSNAFEFAADDDFGTNDEIRGIVNTQAIPPNSANSPIPNLTDESGTYYNNEMESQNEVYSTNPGVGAPSDDGTTQGILEAGAVPEDSPTGSNSVVTLANKTARAIVAKDNVLDKLASYTYSISIYLMSPEDYRRMLTSGKRFLAGYQLLMQSGGIPLTSGVVSSSNLGDADPGGINLAQGRNQFFPLDYYLDDLSLKSVINGKGTGGAHNVVEMKFKIIEPSGITLLDNLYKAARQYSTVGGGASLGTSRGNYAAQNYLMVVRFYGYDQNGNLVTAPTGTDPAGKSDAKALVEKFIPFQFTSIKFRIANKLTEYDCAAVCPQNVIATGQGRGVIPYNIELTATTLQNLFNGNVSYTAPNINTAPNNAAAAPNPTLTTGLTQALNKYQTELKNEGSYERPDVYKIVISHPELANASIVPPGDTDRQSKPMINPTTAAQAKDNNAQSVNNNAKTVSAIAGTSIVQFLDLAVRSSDYVFKQQTKIKTQDALGREIDVPQGAGAQAFAWYRIGVEAKPIAPDPKRNDLAYEITYEIAPYGINDIKSEYFPKGRFRGAQKKYSYWFTGENSSILNFEQDFNYLYYITLNTGQQKPSRSAGTPNYREIEKALFAPNSPQSNQGIGNNSIEPSANAADYLYSPADQGRVRMTIIGDPAWIQQGEVWSGIRSTKSTNNTNSDVYFDAFLPDGTINFDAREALFELTFNKPSDYSLESGTMKDATTMPTQNYIYKALEVTSNFKQGKFTQDLEGVLLLFPEDAIKVNTFESDVNRLFNIGDLSTSRVSTNGITTGTDIFTTGPVDDSEPDVEENDTVRPADEPEPPTSDGEDIGVDDPGEDDIDSGDITDQPSQIIASDD
jgi:hypothetical protein